MKATTEPTSEAKETSEATSLEREKVEIERRRLESEINFKQLELESRREELKVKPAGERRNVWFTSPILVAARRGAGAAPRV